MKKTLISQVLETGDKLYTPIDVSKNRVTLEDAPYLLHELGLSSEVDVCLARLEKNLSAGEKPVYMGVSFNAYIDDYDFTPVCIFDVLSLYLPNSALNRYKDAPYLNWPIDSGCGKSAHEAIKAAFYMSEACAYESQTMIWDALRVHINVICQG